MVSLAKATSSLQFVRLDSDETARSKATARSNIKAGTVVLYERALSTALFPAEKGRRCDHCHRVPAGDERLLKCSGCASFWYCGSTCQNNQWQAHHRKICKRYNRFITTSEYQTLDSGEKTDALLLSQMLVQVYPSDDYSGPSPESSDSVAVFLDLMKGPRSATKRLPLCRHTDSRGLEPADDIYARFGNNNFVVHSHLTSYAHGIFALASRLFNHSCYPNCVMKYIIAPQDVVTMDVVAIRDIAEGEEITVPYLDPALSFETRRSALRANYGFTCECALCAFQEEVGPIRPLPADSSQIHALEAKLCVHVLSRPSQSELHPAHSTSEPLPWASLPVDLCTLFNEAYLPQLSETFSRTSHEGRYEEALSSGRTLLAYYAVIYTSNYPQIGMHALELAKTAWNYVVACGDDAMTADSSSLVTKRTEESARQYLVFARRTLECFGPEGDEGGPLEEIRIMRELLHVQDVDKSEVDGTN